jgi:hypothetical protein
MTRQGAAAVVISDIDDEGGRETARLVEDAGGTAAYLVDGGALAWRGSTARRPQRRSAAA